MKRYIAFLRGVNVGGRNKITMPVLKSAFEETEFSNVSTYINSGNVLFSAKDENNLAVQLRCQEAIANQFELDIPVAVISAADYLDALSHAPEWWDSDGASKHIAIFLIAPAKAGDLMHGVGVRAEYERIFNYGEVIFWSAPLKTFSRTKWAKVIAAAEYSMITIRNANTAKKLLALLKQP